MELLKIIENFLTEKKDAFPVNMLVGVLGFLNLWLPNEGPNRVNIGSYPPIETKD